MYIVNKEDKTTKELKSCSFKSCGFTERYDLQEWIANNPEMLGEELLIIQKEFDGFKGVRERLDLLAIDKNGNLVIIENKLDDSGKDVVGQAMKYAGYCSTLSKEDIVNIYQEYLMSKGQIDAKDKNIAETNILDFLGKKEFLEVQLNQDLTQRIILVAKEFRKEVTNTVIWARKYGIKIQCIKINPFSFKGEVILDVDQIIPVKETEDIVVKYDKKAQEDNKDKEAAQRGATIKKEFWLEFLPKFNKRSNLFLGRNIEKAQGDHFFSTGAGTSGTYFTFYVIKDRAEVAFDIFCSTVKQSNDIFDYLYNYKEEIEKSFGMPLIWERKDALKSAVISYPLNNVSVYNKEDWPQITEFLTENMIKLEQAFRKHIDEYSKNK